MPWTFYDSQGRPVAKSSFTTTLSAANSTTTPLGAGATFTGAFEEVKNYATIIVAAYASHASAALGLKIEYSDDGTNVRNDDAYNVEAGGSQTITVFPMYRYLRVRYVNGATAQTSFGIQVQYHDVRTKPSSTRLGDTFTDDTDGEVVIATIRGKDEAGVYRQARMTESGGLLVESASLTTPPDTTSVTRTAYDSVATTTDTLYTITNGKTLVIQRLSGGGESSTGGSVVELYEDPNGNLSVLNVIETIFVAASSFQVVLNAEFVGNGTRRILLRRRRFDGGARTLFGRWEGYEKTT